VAEHFGLKATQVYHYIKIASLPEDILELVDDETLSLKAAAALSKLDSDELAQLKEQLGVNFDTDHVLKAIYPIKYEWISIKVPIEKSEAVKKAIEETLKAE